MFLYAAGSCTHTSCTIIMYACVVTADTRPTAKAIKSPSNNPTRGRGEEKGHFDEIFKYIVQFF